MKIQTSQFCTNPEDCPECLIKAKFNINNNKKCVKHSILFQQITNSIEYSKDDLLDQIIYCLQDTQRMIKQLKSRSLYTKPGHSLSKSTLSNESVYSQLQEVASIIKRIQNLLLSDHQIQNKHQTFDSFSKHQASYKTKSYQQLPIPQTQKQNKNKISVQTPQFKEDHEVNNYVRLWVVHFYNQLNKMTEKQSSKLPLIEIPEMNLFYQDLQKKYRQFIGRAQQKDKQFNQLINKLAQYIQKDNKKSPNDHEQSKFLQKYINAITPPRPQKTNQNFKSNQVRSKTPNSKKISQQIDTSIILSNESYIADSSQQMVKLLFAQACSIQSLLGRIDQMQKLQNNAIQN